MALKCNHVVRDPVIVLSPAQRASLVSFLTSLGAPLGSACELRVWFEGPTTPDPRDGVLTAQVTRVAKSLITAGMTPLSGTFSIVDE